MRLLDDQLHGPVPDAGGISQYGFDEVGVAQLFHGLIFGLTGRGEVRCLGFDRWHGPGRRLGRLAGLLETGRPDRFD